MQGRYHMRNVNEMVMVEHHHRETLEHIRRIDPRFKRRRIRHVLQAYPDQIKVGVVYRLEYGDGSRPVPAD